MQALLISPSPDETPVLTIILQKAGFSVHANKELSQTDEAWSKRPTDFILISPLQVNESLIKQVRQLRMHTAVPIMLISDTDVEEIKVELLESGVDCIIERPYGVRTLIAQIKAIARRTAGTSFFNQPSLTQGEITLDPSNRTAKVKDGSAIHLTRLEFRLLHTLISNPGQVIPSENLVEFVWGYSGEGDRELVRGLVQRLRSKIEPDPKNPRYIHNELGVGYYFVGE